MITIIIAPLILLLLLMTMNLKEQRPLNYIMIVILILGVYLVLKKNNVLENMTDSSKNNDTRSYKNRDSRSYHKGDTRSYSRSYQNTDTRNLLEMALDCGVDPSDAENYTMDTTSKISLDNIVQKMNLTAYGPSVQKCMQDTVTKLASRSIPAPKSASRSIRTPKLANRSIPIEKIFKIKSKIKDKPSKWKSILKDKSDYKEIQKIVGVELSSLSRRKNMCPLNKNIIFPKKYKDDKDSFYKVMKSQILKNYTIYVQDGSKCWKISIAKPNQWNSVNIKSEVFETFKKIFSENIKKYEIINMLSRTGFCPFEKDLIEKHKLDEKSFWNKILEHASKKNVIFIRDQNICYRIKVKRVPVWTDLDNTDVLYKYFTDELTDKYGVNIILISKSDSLCNPNSDKLLNDLTDVDKVKKTIGSYSMFYIKDKDANCLKVKLKSIPKAKLFTFIIYEKEIDINKINEVLTLKFNSCKLKIIDELKSVLDQMKKETLDTKIDKSIISKFKNMQIIEDKKTIKLKATINIMYIYKQIITNLTKTYNNNNKATPDTINNFKCLSQVFELEEVVNQPNSIYKVTEPIQGISILNGLTYLIQENKLTIIPNNKTTTYEPTNKDLLNKLNLQLLLKHNQDTDYTSKYIIGEMTLMMVNNLQKIKQLANNWYDPEIKTENFLLKDYQETLPKDKFELLLKYDFKLVNAFILGKNKKIYLFFNNTVLIINENNFEEKQIKDVLGFDIEILSAGLNYDQNKQILISNQDIYFIYDAETDKFSKPELTDTNLNIYIYLEKYVDKELTCKEYGAVLGDLVRSKTIENSSRKSILERLNICS